MDVRCSRCGTEYDFDDALVSERGTTVKCTNCGHQFKVYSGAAGGAAPERWVVRKSSGRELVYTSLRDLQRAIAQKQVGPSDQLSRDGHPPRALHTIAELDPFFQAQGRGRQTGPGAAPVQRTLMGMSPSSATVPGEDTQPDYSPFEEKPAQPVRANPAATPAGGFRRTNAPPPPPRPIPPGPKYGTPEDEPKTVRRNTAPEPAPEAPRTLGSTLMSSSSSAGAPPAPIPSPVIHAPPPVPNDGMSGAFRAYQDSFSDESIPNTPQPRRGAGLKWVVGLVVLGGLAFVAGTVGVRYAKKLNPAPVASAPPPADDRVDKLLAEGNANLSHGDYESAKEQFDKASALSEQNPAVLSALARLEASRADVHWLTLKLLDPSKTTDVQAAKAELDQRLVRVRKTAEAATRIAPTAPAVVRAQIDAYRLDGNVAKGRELVSSLGTDSSDPETAYVLAALDLADANPPWPTVIDRMRTAASDERGPGRAGAALVYALASAGAIDDANATLAKLNGGGVPPALVDRLKEFVNRSAPATSASASAAAAPSATAPATSASAATPTAPVAANPGAAEPVTKAVDFRRLLEDASAAKRSGDFGRAESLYQAAHSQEPGNVEATAGLGDVARMRGDMAVATTYYDVVLQQNPTYLPTLIASADMKWAAGNRPAALALYKRVANQADPGTPYGQHAAQRIAEAQSSSGSSGSSGSGGTTGSGGGSGSSGGGTAAPTATPPAKPAEPPTDLPKPPSDTPGVDTSDLPGFK